MRKKSKGNYSLFIFSEDNKIRIAMKRVEKSKYFINSILLLILITSITLAFENPLVDPNSERS